MNITKRGDGIFEKHHTKTGEHVLETLGLERMNLCIDLQKIDTSAPLCSFVAVSSLRYRQHRGGNIDASNGSARRRFESLGSVWGGRSRSQCPTHAREVRNGMRPTRPRQWAGALLPSACHKQPNCDRYHHSRIRFGFCILHELEHRVRGWAIHQWHRYAGYRGTACRRKASRP